MMHIVDGGDVHNGEAYHRPEDCQPGYACWNGVPSNPYATTRLDALRKLRREGYAVVDAKSWRLRSDFGVVEAEPTKREHCRAVHANSCSCCLDLHHFGDHRTLWGDTWSQAARTQAANRGGE